MSVVLLVSLQPSDDHLRRVLHRAQSSHRGDGRSLPQGCSLHSSHHQSVACRRPPLPAQRLERIGLPLLDRVIVEVYGEGGAQVLVGDNGNGFATEPVPAAPVVWVAGGARVNVTVAVATVRSAIFKSDPGPWNPL